MCLAIPAKIISFDDLLATVDIMGARRDISLILVPDEVSVGDYVLVHAGFALRKVDEAAAQESIKLIREYEEALERSDAECAESPSFPTSCSPF
ncbi:MAG TPA: HypC/HybG/HupF family hydrogenase formation chaperone [Dissulfurispiraceae bacterium]|nr:HypC/HybG/HupF family hydrogenase formation chaperone [Dissulfurispiraceae bacterium]